LILWQGLTASQIAPTYRLPPKYQALLESDSVSDGGSSRAFNLLDDCHPVGLGIEVDFCLPSERDIHSLERISE
jgi:putative transposase